MSQNRTVIQGFEAADTNVGGAMGSNPNFYSRGGGAPARGTVVPGMENIASNAPRGRHDGPPYEPEPEHRQTRPAAATKPIVGFLYSVSRTPLGEYWPLQLGKNRYGKNADADITLAEGTVSSNHAVIIIRQGKTGLIAAIKDSESTNGTFINGEPIDFSAEECHNGDILTIGNNYKLLFILIDPSKAGLETSKDFISTQVEGDEEAEDEMFDVPSFGGRGTSATRPGGFDTDFSTQNHNAGGTVGLDGSTAGFGHGGTVPL